MIDLSSPAGPLTALTPFGWLEWSLLSTVIVGVLVVWMVLRPAVALRIYLWLLRRTVYRLKVSGAAHVPATGPGLIVCNHLQYLDWLWLWAALPRRARLVVLAGWASQPWPRRLLRWTGALWADGKTGARDVVRTIREARRCLARGELVCVFVEHPRFAAGLDLPFHRLYRLLTRGRPVAVTPVSIDQPAGSRYRVQDNTIHKKELTHIPHAVWTTFGPPLPAGSPAAEVVQSLHRLSAQAAVERRRTMLPPHRQFVRMASRHPFRPCIYDSATRGPMLSYGKVLAGSMVLARHLRPILGDEKMVAVWLPPGSGGALSNIALALLGKTSVNLNYTSSPEAVESALRQCGVRHVLTANRFLQRVPLDLPEGVEPVLLDELLPKISKGEKLRSFLKVLLLPRFVLERWVLGLGRHGPDDPGTIIFSSGSTGDPKGVMLSHGNVGANVESMIQVTGLSSKDRVLGVLPFFHSFGYTVTLWTPLTVGAAAVYHADPRQAKEIGDLCRKHGCTIFLNTATFLRFCAKKCDPDDFRSLRILMCGAEKLPPALAQEFLTRFGKQPLEGYGCTELSPAAAANLPDEEYAGVTHVRNRTGSIGPPLPGCSARVLDPDTNEPLPAGREGLLLIGGANVMRGYLDRPDLTEKVLTDGEYRTGDMARLDSDGFITLTGRLSRFAKIGGEMVPLEKVEEELHGLLQSTERVLAVASVPCERKGERLVVLHLGAIQTEAHELTRGLIERGLPNLWVPGERDFFPVPQLPVLGSGKLDLRGVKEMALALVRGGVVAGSA